MKEWAIVLLAGVGAFAIYKHLCMHKQHASGASNLMQSRNGVLSGINASGAQYGSMLKPGIPVYSGVPVPNKPDQPVAYAKTNSYATQPQTSTNYTPAFGPDENRGGMETF